MDPANPRSLIAYSGTALTLQAEGVAHATRVIFFADPKGQLGRDIGTVTALADGEAVLTWSPPLAGRYTIYAQASNERGEFVTSEATELLVAPTGQEPPSP
jgi:hypothetical protein